MTKPQSFFDTDIFLGELPEATYQEHVQRKLPRQRQRHFANLFSDVQRDYNRALVSFARQNRGVAPTANPQLSTFSNFLSNYDFDDKFFEEPPWERDRNYGALNAPTKFMFRT